MIIKIFSYFFFIFFYFIFFFFKFWHFLIKDLFATTRHVDKIFNLKLKINFIAKLIRDSNGTLTI